VNLFGSYAYANRDGVDKLDIQRSFYQAQDGTRRLVGGIAQTSVQNLSTASHTWKVGADYNLSEATVVGAAVSGLDNRAPLRESTTHTALFDANNRLTETYRAVSTRGFDSPNAGANLTYKHTFAADSNGRRELTADVDYARYTSRRPQDLSTFFELSGRPTLLLEGDQNGT
jgi:hypothetical protein